MHGKCHSISISIEHIFQRSFEILARATDEKYLILFLLILFGDQGCGVISNADVGHPLNFVYSDEL